MEVGPDADAHLADLRASVEERLHRSAAMIDSTRRRAREQRANARAMRAGVLATTATARAMYERAEHQFARSMGQAIRNDVLFTGDMPSTVDVWRAVLERVGSVYPGGQSVSLTAVSCDGGGRDLRYATVASSGTAARADAAQYALDEGPCLDAVELDRVVVIGTDDLASDAYPVVWPRFTAAARDLGIRSVISIGIPWSGHRSGPRDPHHPPVGAINVYSATPYPFFAAERRAIKLGVHVGARLTGADPEEIYTQVSPGVGRR